MNLQLTHVPNQRNIFKTPPTLEALTWREIKSRADELSLKLSEIHGGAIQVVVPIRFGFRSGSWTRIGHPTSIPSFGGRRKGIVIYVRREEEENLFWPARRSPANWIFST